MALSFSRVLSTMKESIDINETRISADAKKYLTNKAEEFIKNITKNSLQFTREANRKTIFKGDIEKCIDSLSLILKNMPKSS